MCYSAVVSAILVSNTHERRKSQPGAYSCNILPRLFVPKLVPLDSTFAAAAAAEVIVQQDCLPCVFDTQLPATASITQVVAAYNLAYKHHVPSAGSSKAS